MTLRGPEGKRGPAGPPPSPHRRSGSPAGNPSSETDLGFCKQTGVSGQQVRLLRGGRKHRRGRGGKDSGHPSSSLAGPCGAAPQIPASRPRPGAQRQPAGSHLPHRQALPPPPASCSTGLLCARQHGGGSWAPETWSQVDSRFRWRERDVETLCEAPRKRLPARAGSEKGGQASLPGARADPTEAAPQVGSDPPTPSPTVSKEQKALDRTELGGRRPRAGGPHPGDRAGPVQMAPRCPSRPCSSSAPRRQPPAPGQLHRHRPPRRPPPPSRQVRAWLRPAVGSKARPPAVRVRGQSSEAAPADRGRAGGVHNGRGIRKHDQVEKPRQESGWFQRGT